MKASYGVRRSVYNAQMDAGAIRAKFGGDYAADEHTFVMGIDQRFTERFAERFRGSRVLETCTGAGFTTLALARTAAHVTTVEIEPAHQRQAIGNAARAGLLDRVTFLLGDVLDAQARVLLATPNASGSAIWPGVSV